MLNFGYAIDLPRLQFTIGTIIEFNFLLTVKKQQHATV